MFEFVKGTNDLCVATNVQVSIAAAQSASTVRGQIVIAVNSVTTDLEIVASGATGSVVTLTHERFTGLGNQPILDTVTDVDFTVNGMSGGSGGDCAMGQTCLSNEDCISNDCQLNVCQ